MLRSSVSPGQPQAINAKFLNRIKKDLEELKLSPLQNITVNVLDDNLTTLEAVMNGEKRTVYEGGIFKLSINLPPQYPSKAPLIHFETAIYHCNVSSTGYICLDKLHKDWQPLCTLSQILLAIYDMMHDCNPATAVNPIIADLYLYSRDVHDKYARKWTKLYAGEKSKALQLSVLCRSDLGGKLYDRCICKF
ncbi:ubiquitin-conjugating enzyme E2-24 kDa-like [Teleopsis dalmanni]|uniref:ubiquitin-conjugating enzyme E2-24 kDa-like n=1 Tax=Teleopsis dalmanni TaxID=139649 RepID=UPI0018CE1D41|nr:ubiquitin-conjugating enzyme E2-24 kDa-like [Teleopsis dalmanni]